MVILLGSILYILLGIGILGICISKAGPSPDNALTLVVILVWPFVLLISITEYGLTLISKYFTRDE